MTNYNERLDKRLDDLTSFMESIDWEFDENGYTFEDNYINFRTADMLRQAITADRKRVALEARLDENNMYIRELTRHYFPSGPSEPHIPLVQFHERIAELKAKQEEL